VLQELRLTDRNGPYGEIIAEGHRNRQMRRDAPTPFMTTRWPRYRLGVSGARQLLLEGFERRSCCPARRRAFRPWLWRVFARDNACNEEPVASAPTLRAFATTVETRGAAGLAWVREFSSHLALPSGG
jgi:hypothetical protein